MAITPINVVGIGLDGAAGLTSPVRDLVNQATVLVGSDRHLSYFLDHPARRIVLGDLGVAIRQIKSLLDQISPAKSRYVPPYNNLEPVAIVIFAPGDPLFFGLGKLLIAEIPPENITFHPHLTPVQLAFNRLKLPWQDAQILSIHGRSLDQIKAHLQVGTEKIAILTESPDAPGAIAQLYLALALPYEYHLWVCENLGEEQEKIQAFSLDAPSFDTQGLNPLVMGEFAPLNVVILVRKLATDTSLKSRAPLPIIGLPDQEFFSFSDYGNRSYDRPLTMAQRELRILALGELALQPEQIIWDIGAGHGAVSIEIARLCPTSRIYALEKSVVGTSLIEQNIQRFQVSNVISIHGHAPDMLRHLPAPDRIFMSNISDCRGSAKNSKDDDLGAILDACGSRLKPEGVMVMAIDTLEYLHQSLAWYRQKAWQVKILQVQLSKSVAISELTSFTPLNPITVVTAISRSNC